VKSNSQDYNDITLDNIGVIFCHDDKLTFRGQKHEIGLDEDWKQVAPKTGEVYRYGQRRVPMEYDSKGREVWDYITIAEYEALPESDRQSWYGCRARAITLPDDVIIHAEGSFVDIRMLNLWENFGTRYRSSLDALVRAVHRGLVSYTGKGAEGSRQELEAMRRRFNNHWHAVAYEHDLILPVDIGKALLDELASHDMAKGAYPGTVYTKGYDTKKSMHVKVYDMRAKHGLESVKLEVTLRQDYLEYNGMKVPKVWEEQPDIQSRIESTLRREWRIVFDKAKGAKAMLAERVQVKPADLFDFMVDTKNTLTAVKDRLATVERIQAQQARDIEQLKRATGLK
jgi:hypothetical protein